jgi:hypothetical protein
MRTRVLITVDTEFSIGGAFDRQNGAVEPLGAQNVFCMVDGVSEGLGFILDTLGSYSLVASFFVETMQTAYFGDAPMRDVTQHIRSSGHDIQLHLHPVWMYFDKTDWRRRLEVEVPSDELCGRPVDLLVSWLQRGIGTFGRWDLPPPLAMRAGNLRVDRNVYRAMSRTGMKIGSNIGRGVFDPVEPALRCNGGIHRIDGIIELPVLSYVGMQWPRRRLKSLTIAGSSTPELIHLLEHAHRTCYPCVVLLTHCHEFVKGRLPHAIAANTLTQSRLRLLCRFLADHSDRFEVTSIGALANASELHPSSSDPLFDVPTSIALRRMFENKLNDYTVQ